MIYTWDSRPITLVRRSSAADVRAIQGRAPSLYEKTLMHFQWLAVAVFSDGHEEILDVRHLHADDGRYEIKVVLDATQSTKKQSGSGER